MGKRHIYELIAAAVLFAVILIGFFVYKYVDAQFEPFSGKAALEYTPGGWEDMTSDDLDGKIEAGMINISMNTIPVFASGESEGNLMIVNEEVNRYPQIVEISRNDTGETIYTSGAIPVGSKIEAAKLDKALAVGKYDCTALFYSMDPDTGARLGCAGAAITITIL